MLCVISPAKKITVQQAATGVPTTRPALSDEARQLGQITKRLSRTQIKQMMGLSDNLAELTHARFAALDIENNTLASPAALTFAGDVYRGLDAASLSADDMAFAQDHLRILSGLYGVLRPLDMMQPYRLEMGRKLKTPRGEDLYDFWGPRIADVLKNDLERSGTQVLLNLASNEYFKSVDKKSLDAQIISPVFKEIKEGNSRVLAVFAKPARGMMARWIIKNRVNEASQLKDFAVAGYRYDAQGSTPEKFLFARQQPAKKAA
ncbi:MAG: hypothetical protein COA84_01110 [Robiginitomaculum sp.]|nr:MAG: hypothetical protein COA84_01110 [Robiginitomaculum sp.]